MKWIVAVLFVPLSAHAQTVDPKATAGVPQKVTDCRSGKCVQYNANHKTAPVRVPIAPPKGVAPNE